MINLGFKWRSYADIEKVSEEYLDTHELHGALPVPIEDFLDVKLGIHLITFPNLTRTREINSYLSNSFKSIYVDEYLFYHMEKPLRFSLAHELGHIALHRDVYKKHKPKSSSEWEHFINNLSELDRSVLEGEADNFSGLFLVPQKHLYPAFTSFVEKNKTPFLRICKQHPKNGAVTAFTKYIAEQLSDQFNVSPQVIEIRVKKSNLVSQLYALCPPDK